MKPNKLVGVLTLNTILALFRSLELNKTQLCGRCEGHRSYSPVLVQGFESNVLHFRLLNVFTLDVSKREVEYYLQK